MKTAIYPGSFDPLTNGHLDVLKSALRIFDKVIIAVAYNPNKQGFLPIETRTNLIKNSIKQYRNVEVEAFAGLTVDFAKKHNANVIVRGLRTSFDFEYEMQLSQTNNLLDNNIQTVFFITKPEYSFISSSAVREIVFNNGDISKFVPEPVEKYLSSYNYHK